MSQAGVPSVERVLPEAFEKLESHKKALAEMIYGVRGPSYSAGGYAHSAPFAIEPLQFSPEVTMHARMAHTSLKTLLLTLVPDAALHLPNGQMLLSGAAVAPHHAMHDAFGTLVVAIKGAADGSPEARLMDEVGKLAGTLDKYFPVLEAQPAPEEPREERAAVVAVPAVVLAQRAAAAGHAPLRGYAGADSYWRARAAALAAAILLLFLTPDRLTNGGHGVFTGGPGFAAADVAPDIVTKSAVCPDDKDAPCAVTHTEPDRVVVAQLPLPYEHLFDFDPKAIKIAAPAEDTLSDNFCCFAANAGCIRNLEMFREVVAATAAHVGEIGDGKMWLDRLNDQTLSEEKLAFALKEVSHFFYYTAKTPNADLALKAATLATILVPDSPALALHAAKVMEHAGDMYLRHGYQAHALDFIERALDLLDRVPASADTRSLYKRLYSMSSRTNVIDAGTDEPDERAVVRGEYACGIRPLVP